MLQSFHVVVGHGEIHDQCSFTSHKDDHPNGLSSFL